MADNLSEIGENARVLAQYAIERPVNPRPLERLTPTDRALDALWPWHGEDYPGKRRCAESFFGRPWSVIREWCRRRPAGRQTHLPSTARALLIAELERRATALRGIAHALEVEGRTYDAQLAMQPPVATRLRAARLNAKARREQAG
ncbi:MAG: hypothetical protein C5B50_00745 [Verrucomicrobia bacterium]|nr:MAG: hypothetical protein C5B50_00745 [Verrucomicrobiota bacterium]